MRLCEGGDIFSVIQDAPRFSERMAINIMKQVVNAVLYCHLNKIVHRDIKADNILFMKNDLNSPVKLIDFGISVKYEKGTKLREKTGTILYIAPEVIDGSYDEKCDIWSLGVLLYTMLGSQPPFYGKSRKEIIQKIKKGVFNFKPNSFSLVSSEAKDLISRLLVLDPAKRPSCKEILAHPWFLKEVAPSVDITNCLENMKKFKVPPAHQTESQLAKSLLTFIATNIASFEDTKELLATFKRLDTNHDGKLSKQEIEQGYREAFPHFDDQMVSKIAEDIVSHADSNFSGEIDYTEYLVSAVNMKLLITKDILKKTFLSFDLVLLDDRRTATGGSLKKSGRSASEA